MINPYVGIGSLYRANNPAERRVLAASKVAENAGFAKPLIYATMGADMAEAEKWDQDQQSTIVSALSENVNMQRQQFETESAHKVLNSIIKISEQDPEEATQVLQIAAKQYPGLAMYAGVKFTAKTKDDWMHVAGGDGQQYAVSKTGLAWMAQNQDKITDEIRGKYIVPVGGPSNKAPQSRTVNRGGTEVTEEWDPEGKTWKQVASGPRWKPGEGGSSSKEDMKDYRKIETDINALRNKRISSMANYNLTTEEKNGVVADIDEAIKEKEYYLKTEHPDMWKKRTAGRSPRVEISSDDLQDALKQKVDDTAAVLSGQEKKGTGAGAQGKQPSSATPSSALDYVGLMAQAKEAIAQGADKKAVRRRLKTIGYSDKQLDGAYFNWLR